MSVRITRSRTASAIKELPTVAVSAPPAKKRKTQPKPKTVTVAALPPPLPTPHTPAPFVLDDAISHLTSVDRRFAALFERIPCKPFIAAADGQPVAGAALAVASAAAAGTDDTSAEPVIDPFASLVRSIIGQQVSWLAARSITRRFVEHFCGPQDGDMDDIRHGKGSFPTAKQVAASDVMALKGVGCSTRKAEYCELYEDFTDNSDRARSAFQ